MNFEPEVPEPIEQHTFLFEVHCEPNSGRIPVWLSRPWTVSDFNQVQDQERGPLIYLRGWEIYEAFK